MFDSVISSLPATRRDSDHLADRLALFDLVKEERYARDHNQWERLVQCYTPRSRIKVMWFAGTAREFADASVRQVRGPSFGRHMVVPMEARVSGRRAWVEAEATIQVRLDHRGMACDIENYVRFLYRAERMEEGWRLVSFDCIYIKDTMQPAMPGEALPVTTAELREYRPSYCFMSWLFTQTGHSVDQDLAGVDRAETVDAVYRAMQDWLDGGPL
jgi:SnoaL-like domain